MNIKQNAKDKTLIIMFGIIKKRTNYCASCGVNFDMKISGHSHFPFCEKCRVIIIKEEMGSTEKACIK